tara:strand:+ start:286 stop:1734 length:1449 start_codon:yes stop_codon:yes gene_type:complete
MFKLDYIYFRRLFNKLWKKEIFYNQFSDKYYFSAYIKSYVCDDNTHLDYYKDDVMGHFRTYNQAEEFFDELRSLKNKMYRLLVAKNVFVGDFGMEYVPSDAPLCKLYRAVDDLVDYFNDNKFEFYNLAECSCCGEVCGYDDTFSAYNGDETVGECCQGQYSYCDEADTYFRDDDYESWEQYQEPSDEDYDSGFEGVYRYDCDPLDYLYFMHTKSESSIPRHKQRWSGLEIEMEATSRCPEDLPLQIRNVFKDNYCIFKSDGSLSHGFELVSAPCTLAYHRERIEELFDSGVLRDDEGKAFVRGWNTDTAGMHIHLDRKMLSSVQVGKLLVFINNEFNRSFIEKIAGRSETFYEDSDCTSYAVMRKKKITDGGQRNYNKYEAVNLAHSSTVELRIFRSNLTKDGIMRALEFSYALVDFLQQNTCRESDQHYKEFLKWFNRSPQNRASYPYFYGWLVRKGYLSGIPSRSITRQYDQAIDAVVNQ